MTSSISRWRHVADPLVIAAATFALHAAIARQSGVLNDGSLRDTDAFMRLIRVQELWVSGNWYQNVTSTLGAPEGLSLHWTRPLDVLILLPALLLHLGGMAMERAVYWSGAALSPVLHFATCLAAASVARLIWERHGAWRIAALAILFNGAAISYSMVGRPDHHSLGLLLAVIAAGQTMRAVLDPETPRRSWLAGAWSAAGIWVSPEALIGVAPCLITFGILWLTDKSDDPTQPSARWARLGRFFCLGMAAVVLLAILIEQPPSNWLVPEYDKVSILHLVIVLTAAADFRLAEALRWKGLPQVAMAGLIAVLSAFGLALLFPHFYLGPLGNITDQAAKVFLDDVKEMSPLWPTSAVRADQFFSMIGNSLAALLVIPYCLWRWRGTPPFRAALFLSLSYGVALIGALLHQRLAVPLGAYGALLGCGLFSIVAEFAERKRPLTRITMRVAACMMVVFVGQIWMIFSTPPEGNAFVQACEPKPVAEWLNANHPGIVTPGPKGAQRHTPIILTESINYTPDLAYRTDYRFVGGPYHRGIDDITDMFNAATGTDDASVHEIVARRQATFVLICIKEVPKAIGESAPDSLYHRLLKGQPPAWLQLIPMSPEASREFRLFAVTR